MVCIFLTIEEACIANPFKSSTGGKTEYQALTLRSPSIIQEGWNDGKRWTKACQIMRCSLSHESFTYRKAHLKPGPVVLHGETNLCSGLEY